MLGPITMDHCYTCTAFFLDAVVPMLVISHLLVVFLPCLLLQLRSFYQHLKTINPSENNLVILISKILTKYIDSLSAFSRAIPPHILHEYSKEMGTKSEVIVLDVLMKNEAKHGDMIDIMKCMQGYLGENYPDEGKVLSEGDQRGKLEHSVTPWMVILFVIGLAFLNQLLKIGIALCVYRL